MSSGRDKFEKYKGLINSISVLFSFLGKRLNKFLFLFFRNTNGVFGLVVRYALLKNLVKSIGDNVSIQPGVFIFHFQNIEIGNNVSIHSMCYIDGAGGLKVGNNVSIAHSSSILTSNHTWKDNSLPIKYNKEELNKVIIHDDVWIGCGVRILSGVQIKSRSVIAAGAVVNKGVISNSVYGGVPAKLIKEI